MAALGKTTTNPFGLEFLLQDNYEDMLEGGEPHAGSKGVHGLTVTSYAKLAPAAKT